MSKLRNKKKKVTLVSKFAFIIGVSVAFSVIFISAYNIYASKPIVKQYNVDKINEFNSLSNLIYEKYKTTYLEEKNYDTFKIFINELVKNDLVLHVGIVDNFTNKYKWSSVQELEGTITHFKYPWINTTFKKHFSNFNEKDIFLKTIQVDDTTIVVSFFMNSSLLKLVEILKSGNFMLALTFIIFGFLSSSILARQVTKPIEKLVVGVWEFSKGNLEYRTPIETDDEIGILAKAFNYMAEKLNDLYQSLEKKVKERTLELSSKNDELNSAYEELKDAQSLLVHNEKMRSLGELVAGVAHELNNPINFIYGNMTHLKEYSQNMIDIISKYEESESTISEEKKKEIEDLKEDIDYEFLKEDISGLIKSCAEGAERSKQIVIDLKNFSRLDQAQVKEIDINESIDSTLNILQNKFKDRVNMNREYGDLPMLTCYAGQINQVFMNILDNAAQSIEGTGDVNIKTSQIDNNIVIEIKDCGEGIDDETIHKIFDPFFTTKPVGSGTGMGLSISYKIIKSHNGTIEVESEKGVGSKFTIKIPLNWQELEKKEKPKEKAENESIKEESVN